MSIRPPRRIFRSQAQGARREQAFGTTVIAGIAGAIIGGLVVLFSAPSDLFGRSPAPYGHVFASAATFAIVDAQTLWLDGTLVRLEGVDAPPRGRACEQSNGALHDCGAAAVAALSALVRDRDVTCDLAGRDAEGFTRGLCRAGDVPLNRGLIAAGWARATSDLAGFQEDERAARAAHRGLWAHPTAL